MFPLCDIIQLGGLLSVIPFAIFNHSSHRLHIEREQQGAFGM